MIKGGAAFMNIHTIAPFIYLILYVYLCRYI
jgi:hypothetical protein